MTSTTDERNSNKIAKVKEYIVNNQLRPGLSESGMFFF
jgi:hypothetical protein